MKVVAIGGGTGLSVLLRGLKNYDLDLTAIVAVTDEGGSSGKIRQELEIPPPGDVRNNIIALAQDESLMSRIFSYRFQSNGTLSNHSVGNIILAALTRMTGSFNMAVKLASNILAIKGKVLPVCEQLIRLVAHYDDGATVIGETQIIQKRARIISVELDKPAKALDEVIETLETSDVILIGPGSLYTSVITNFLVDGVSQAINHNKKAIKIYIANIMTQPGETLNMNLQDHVSEVEKYLQSSVDFIIANSSNFPKEIIDSYSLQGAEPVIPKGAIDDRYILKPLLKTVYEPSDPRLKARHDSDLLAKTVLEICWRGTK
ncbi:gluconeogenesis factor YvcK family protein [Thermotoga profunda]|uniref:gluconeogenesis factor YvcK family protein n=1 Tax=Thermotoga profunda TaxID=1508420 RepID=UPI000596C1E8|nr:uridine diphosphate-N-acetylglucosamine-binding protein YvcK [Thermotoga profunda]